MNLLIKKDIKDNTFIVDITIASFGTETMLAEDEKALLENFPTKVNYKDITFKKNIKIVEEAPVIATEEDVEDEGTTTESMEIKLAAQTIPLDENFKATYKVELSKTLVDENSTILTSNELVCQAKCEVFIDGIKTEITKIMENLRGKAVNFEGEFEEEI